MASNGTTRLLRAAGLALSVVVLLVTATIALAGVRERSYNNERRIARLEDQREQQNAMLYRIDKRVAVIAAELGVAIKEKEE